MPPEFNSYKVSYVPSLFVWSVVCGLSFVRCRQSIVHGLTSSLWSVVCRPWSILPSSDQHWTQSPFFYSYHRIEQTDGTFRRSPLVGYKLLKCFHFSWGAICHAANASARFGISPLFLSMSTIWHPDTFHPLGKYSTPFATIKTFSPSLIVLLPFCSTHIR